MKMGKLEKRFVNSKRHAEKNIELLERLFSKLDLSNTKNALEIGCGVGVVSAYLNSHYKMSVIGTDIDPEQIEIAKKFTKEHQYLKFIESDAIKLPFDDNEFDMVLSIFVIHHINDWDKALGEVNRIIKSNGYFIFHDLVYSRFTTRIFKRLVKRFGVYTIDDIIQFLIKNNFEIVNKERPMGALMKHHSIVFRKK